MAEQTAVRPEETRSKEDTIRKWLSRLLSLKAPNHQIIEVPLPADAGETESQNDCITTPPAPAATATTPSHPHSGEELPPPQSEKPIPKDLTSSHRLPTDRHEVSQPILDRTPQQVPAEDDRATQNGDKAHTLQSTHPRTKDKGKTIARITNDAGLSSINVPVSANVPTAQCDLNAPAIQAYPVEIPYSKTFTERLSKVENLYMDKTAIIAPAINSRWKNEIQRKLDKDLQDLIKAKFGAKDNILSTAQLYMVGSKHKKTLAVKPTIIITCGTMESKKWIAEELSNLKLHYLDDFGCPWRVRYEPKPTSWTASPPDETPSTPFGTMGHDIPNLQGVYVEQNIKPGVSGLKLRFDVLQDGITQHRYATLGGIISINDANLLMTTAHPFLAELDSGNEPLVSDDMEASMSDSDSNSQSDSEMAEPPNIPRTSLPFDQMRYSRLWTSEQWTRVAYSFLGRISLSNAGNAVNLQWPSSSDWALFQVRERSLLSKSQISPQFSSFITEDRLTPGEVKIIDTVDALSAGFLTQTAVSIHTAKAVMHVREILLSGVLSNGASGAWVVRGSDVCGYVVAATGSGKSCFMVPMYCGFEEIEAAFGMKPKLGVEQVDPSEEKIVGASTSDLGVGLVDLSEEVTGASYDSRMESTSDDHQPADSTRKNYGIPRSTNPTSAPAAESSKVPWIHSLTRKGVSILRKGRRPYEPLSISKGREAGLRSAPRSQADSRDPYQTEMMDMEEVTDTAIELLPIGRVDERSTPIIPKPRQEDVVDNRKEATHWSPRKKARNFLVILILMFINTLASTVVAPGVPLIMHEFSVNNVLGAFTVSIFVLGQVSGPLLVAPLSESYGRLLVYHGSNLGFIIWNVACALAPNAGALLIFRFFAGCAAAGPLTIGRSSVEDMFSTEIKYDDIRLLGLARNEFLSHRDTPLVLLSIASMLGPCIGPVFGGYLVEKESWRWAFWLLAIAGGLVTIAAMIVMSETSEWAISKRGTRKSHRLLRWLIPRDINRLRIKKPFKSLRLSWTMLAPIIYLALMKGYMNILYTTLTPVFTAMYTSTSKWDLISGPGSAGLTFISTFVGTVFGSWIGYMSFVRRRANFHSMMRRSRAFYWRYVVLLVFVASSLLTFSGLSAFGWTVLMVKKTQIFLPLAASTVAIFGTTLGVLTAEDFICRTSNGPIADAINASNFLGSLAGGLLPLIAQRLYLLPFGLGWTNTIYGVGALFILERVGYWYRKSARMSSDQLSRRSFSLEEGIMRRDIEELGGWGGYRSPNEVLLS